MKKVFLLGIAISLFMTSCVKYSVKDENLTPKTTEVALTIETGSLASNSAPERSSHNGIESAGSGEYNRSGAPVYISGVTVTTNSIDFPSQGAVTTDFKFAEGDNVGKGITMTVPYGKNQFSAISITEVDPTNNTYENNINRFSGNTDKIEYYTNELIKTQNIYAVYEGSIPYTVKEENPSLEIPMATESARYGIVLETSDNYDIRMTATLGGVSQVIEKATSEKASAVIFNDANVAAGHKLQVKLEVLVNDVVIEAETKILDGYTAEAGKNKTLIITYNSSEDIKTQEAGISFSWTQMKNEGEIIDID